MTWMRALAIVCAAGAGWILLRRLPRSLRWLFTWFSNSLVAVVAIFLWNLVATPYGWNIGLNAATALTTGALGVWGFCLVLAVRRFGL